MKILNGLGIRETLSWQMSDGDIYGGSLSGDNTR